MTDPTEGRRLSPTSRPGVGTWRMVAAQIGSEVTRYRRVPEYFIGVVVLPVILFAMFGLPTTGEVLPGGTTVVAMLFVSFCCYGVVSQALFSFGAELAMERQKGWLRRLRATPMPMWLYFTGKLALNLVFTVVIVAGVALVAATAGQASFEPARLAATSAVLLLGTVAFSPTGAAIAYWARPKAVSTIVNLAFLPLAFLSGFFFPVEQLPDVLQRIAPWLPTYHFGQIAWRAMAPVEDVGDFTTDAGTSLGLHVAVIGAWALASLALTVWGYRRELDRERG
jgi:ABC-2 type transport system permease protein